MRPDALIILIVIVMSRSYNLCKCPAAKPSGAAGGNILRFSNATRGRGSEQTGAGISSRHSSPPAPSPGEHAEGGDDLAETGAG